MIGRLIGGIIRGGRGKGKGKGKGGSRKYSGITAVHLDVSRLQALEASVEAKADRIVEASARAIQAGFMHRAAVDTGAHRASGTVTKTGPAQRRIGPTRDYSRHVELGTRRMRARPALKPAFDAEVPKLKRQLGNITKG